MSKFRINGNLDESINRYCSVRNFFYQMSIIINYRYIVGQIKMLKFGNMQQNRLFNARKGVAHKMEKTGHTSLSYLSEKILIFVK